MEGTYTKFGLLTIVLVVLSLPADGVDAARRCYDCRGSTSTMIDKLGSFDLFCHEPNEERTKTVDCPSESVCGKAMTQISNGQNVVIRRCLDPRKLESAVQPGNCNLERLQGQELLICTCEEDLCNSVGDIRGWSVSTLLAFGFVIFITTGFRNT